MDSELRRIDQELRRLQSASKHDRIIVTETGYVDINLVTKERHELWSSSGKFLGTVRKVTHRL